MTREQLLEGLYKDLVQFAQEWAELGEAVVSPSNRLYTRTRASSYECVAGWLGAILDREVIDGEAI